MKLSGLELSHHSARSLTVECLTGTVSIKNQRIFLSRKTDHVQDDNPDEMLFFILHNL